MQKQNADNTEATVGRLWATLKTDMSVPLASMGDVLSVIGVCVCAKDSCIAFPYYPNASGGSGTGADASPSLTARAGYRFEGA